MLDTYKVECVREIQFPKNLKQAAAFLGLVNYYRKFIDNCAKMQEPINRLKKKGVKFVWDESCERRSYN